MDPSPSLFSTAQGCARFTANLSELTKTWSSSATECRVWIRNCNVKLWKSSEHKLHKIRCSLKVQQKERTAVLGYLQIISRLMVQVTFISHIVDKRHHKVPENQYWRKRIRHLPSFHQFCVHAVLSLLMLQVIFCGPSGQWHHKWRTADMKEREPFPLLSPCRQLIVQNNKYLLIVGNLILTSNLMDVIDRYQITRIILLTFLSYISDISSWTLIH